MRSFTKFSRLRTFGKKLPAPRKQLHNDLRRIIYDRACGNLGIVADGPVLHQSGKQGVNQKNKSYGLTILQDKHVVVSGAELNFSYIKKSVSHDVTLRDARFPGWCVSAGGFPVSPCFSTIRSMGSATLSNRGR